MTDTEQTEPPIGPPPADPAPRRRSLREFLFEILVVVIGVLIALGAQQTADALHWRGEVADTRAALAEELTNNLAVIRRAQRQDVCNLAHLAALAAWGHESLEGGRQSLEGALANPNARFSSATTANLQAAVWDVAKTSQVAGHIPLQNRLAFARAYTQLDNLQYVVLAQRETWRELTRFADKPALSEAEAKRLLEAVSVGRNLTRGYHLNSTRLAESIKALGAREPAALPPMQVPADCLPTATARPLGSVPTL